MSDSGNELTDPTQQTLPDASCAATGKGWTVLDTQTSQVFQTGVEKTYQLPTAALAYNRFRLRVTRNRMSCPDQAAVCALGADKTKVVKKSDGYAERLISAVCCSLCAVACVL